MNHSEWTSALRDAAEPGAMLPPVQLLSAVSKQADPIRSLSDWDQCEVFFSALCEEFGFFSWPKIPHSPRSSKEEERGIAVLRWAIQEFRRWRVSEDTGLQTLTALFVVIQSCHWDSDVWLALPGDLLANTALSEKLGDLLSKTTIDLSTRSLGAPRIWETEALERFLTADAQRDWVSIVQGWRGLSAAVFSNVFIEQTVRYLFFHDFTRLTQATEGLRSTALTMQITGALSVEQRLRLANASISSHVHFCAIDQTLAAHPRPQKLSSTEELLLADLLLNVSKDETTWNAWMQIYNTVPSQYPALQVSLGRALATVPRTAISGYIGSIHLTAQSTPTDRSRHHVAACLREFRSVATTERRCALWSSAYRRWDSWSFDEKSSDSFLFRISWSELDYAVVGYALECISEEERDAASAGIVTKLGIIQFTWYSSASHFITAWYRLLSRYQPYAHSRDAECAKEWLAETRSYRPTGTDSSYLYLMMGNG